MSTMPSGSPYRSAEQPPREDRTPKHERQVSVGGLAASDIHLLSGIPEEELEAIIAVTEEAEGIQRPSSAPPVLELDAPSLFAFNPTEHYSQIFSAFPGGSLYYAPAEGYQGNPVHNGLPGTLSPQAQHRIHQLQQLQAAQHHSQHQQAQQQQLQRLQQQQHLQRQQQHQLMQHSNQQQAALDDLSRRHAQYPGHSQVQQQQVHQQQQQQQQPQGVWTPLPLKMSTLSLDDFSLDEPLLPDLGDTEPFTVDDYVRGMGADFAEPHGSGERFVGNGGISRYLWEQQMGNGDSSTLTTPMSPSPIMNRPPDYMGGSMSAKHMQGQGVRDLRPSVNNGTFGPPGQMYGGTQMVASQMQYRNRQSDVMQDKMKSAITGPGGPVCRYYAQGMVASPDDPIVSPHPIKAPGVGVRPIMSQGVSANSVHGHQTHSHSAPQMPLSASPVNEPIAPPMSQLQNMAPSNQNELGDARVGKNGVRPNGAAATPRFHTMDQVAGNVYRMCKDQHGCRFLQKKLEEAHPKAVEMIFSEVYDHMVELMTDPFGNYLCQKLIEHCDHPQRLEIVLKVSPHLVSISKNMHGTRAVQKMIECLSSPEQVQLVIRALESNVVDLIQDLNGNHVIQRCLNRLVPADNQFVYNAVADHCMDVATHRHGCCVMQRCIDHASDAQKLQLIREITRNALALVRDPFGNYVVQYVLDLPFGQVKSGLIAQFCGHLAQLSTQKFSSNVIEKCLKCAEPNLRRTLIEEVMSTPTLHTLLRDPYGNYVVQTALGVCDIQQRTRLVAAIRPLLSELRNTPYGKRIQNKIFKEAGTHV